MGARAVLGRLVACKVDLPKQYTWLEAACRGPCAAVLLLCDNPCMNQVAGP